MQQLWRTDAAHRRVLHVHRLRDVDGVWLMAWLRDLTRKCQGCRQRAATKALLSNRNMELGVYLRVRGTYRGDSSRTMGQQDVSVAVVRYYSRHGKLFAVQRLPVEFTEYRPLEPYGTWPGPARASWSGEAPGG